MSDQRAERVLSRIDLATMRGVEVGPSFSPFAKKAAGAQVLVVDHADAGTLREKYRVHGVDIDSIEDVDVVWHGGSLADALGEHEPFDFIIASHFLEHATDPLGFLNDCDRLLRPGGVLSLVLPDHRFCFDTLRPPTTFGQWIDAHLEQRQLHTPGIVFDHWVHAAERGAITWTAETRTALAMIHHRADLDAAFGEARGRTEYVDVHAWVFTPASFSALLSIAQSFGYTSFSIAEATDTIGYEFFVTLSKPMAPPNEEARKAIYDDRLAFLAAVVEAEGARGARPVEPVTPPRGIAARVRSAHADGRLVAACRRRLLAATRLGRSDRG